ncbi:PadR family transcriptional regulator [Nocardia sp. NPDC101769]|uniref:PadR family transcriptional regulator n=1 Tax=Nocardia sp. NPDC101769 TaxID=3364333 RepID=UPI003809A9AE
MKLELLLLGILGIRPSTGYVLKKYFDEHGRFLRPNTQMSQVYRALAKMTEQGWVRYEVDPRPGPQDAKTYYVTPEGMTVFLDWLTSPYTPPPIPTGSEFHSRISFSGYLSEEQILKLVDVELAARHAQVARFRHRDRSLEHTSAFPFDHELATAIGNRLHEFGSTEMDRYIEWLERLRADLLNGRVRSGGEPPALHSVR